MMDCATTQTELPHFVVAQLDAAQTLAVARHLAGCEQCARAESELRRTGQLLRRWQVDPLPESVRVGIAREAQTLLAELPRRAPTRPRGLLTWSERWASLLEATQQARRQLAPGAFAFVALATLFALIVLIRDPSGAARSGALFLAGMWCASVANGVLGLVFGEPAAETGRSPRRIDLRATALSAALAGAVVAGIFLLAGLAKSVTGDYSELWRLALYCVSSFLIVAAAVSIVPRLAGPAGGRVSGVLVGLLYFAFSGPLIYIAINFRLDRLWITAEVCVFVFAVLGGLAGDAFAARRLHTK